MIKKGLQIVFLLFFCFFVSAQNKKDSLSMNFHLKFGKYPLELHKNYISTSKDTLSIATFRCYISNIQIQYSDNSNFIQKNSYHLLDFDNPNSFQISITKKNNKLISKITFNIGIDSLTNTAGAMAGDLDPIKGMYWAWQSGYINMKIEGKSSSCNAEGSRLKNEFQFHIGGYLKPYYAMRKVEILSNNNVNIGIDLNDFFSNINLSQTNSVMIPGKLAMNLADYSVKMFHLE